MDARRRTGDDTRLGDSELLARTSEGDTRAFRVLFDRYRPWVSQFARRRLADEGAAEEAVGDTFYAIWRNAGRFRGESRASTWIYGVAHFKCLAAARARRRYKRASVVPIDAAALARVPDDRSLVEALEARDALRRLRRALLELPVGHRRVMEMAFFEDRPYGEIASRLGIREDTVKTRVARSRARLRLAFRASPAVAVSHG